MNRLLYFLFLLSVNIVHAQQVDPDLLAIKNRMDEVQNFSAMIVLNLDVPFINMPKKTAKITYEKGAPMAFSSSDFVMLPKRGLDFSLSEIFKYSFITVDRGLVQRQGKQVKELNVIPTDNRSELALATLYIDPAAKRIMESEINTRKEGSYALLMQYAGPKDILPNYVEATFAVERLKIPFNFMGKDTQIDRKKMKEMPTKTGKIKMQIKDYQVKYAKSTD